MIFPTPIIPCLQSPPSTPTLTAMSSHAPGGHSQQSSCLQHVSPQTHRPLCVTWPKHTGPYWRPPLNGLVWSFACKPITSLLSTSATTLGSHWPEASMEWSLMQGWISFAAAASAPYPNGLMTIFSSEFCEFTSLSTTDLEGCGGMKYRQREGTGRSAANYGMEAKTCQKGPQKSLVRTAAHPSSTW